MWPTADGCQLDANKKREGRCAWSERGKVGEGKMHQGWWLNLLNIFIQCCICDFTLYQKLNLEEDLESILCVLVTLVLGVSALTLISLFSLCNIAVIAQLIQYIQNQIEMLLYHMKCLLINFILLLCHVAALVKSIGLRNDGRLDDRSYWVSHSASLSIPMAVPLVYPRMISIHDLASKVQMIG